MSAVDVHTYVRTDSFFLSFSFSCCLIFHTGTLCLVQKPWHAKRTNMCIFSHDDDKNWETRTQKHQHNMCVCWSIWTMSGTRREGRQINDGYPSIFSCTVEAVPMCAGAQGSWDKNKLQKNNTWDSNVVPHRSTNQARQCLTSLSRREAVLSLLYGRSWKNSRRSYTI